MLVIAVDFDGTIVRDDLPQGQLELMPGAKEALHALKEAGNILLLYSARSNRGARFAAELDPLNIRLGYDPKKWGQRASWFRQAYQEMVDFVERELPGVFDAIDDGRQGKPTADIFIDDRAFSVTPSLFQSGVGWEKVRERFG